MSEAGARGVTIAGVLGESNRVTDSERQALVEAAKTTIQGVDDKPFSLCVGATHSGTAATVSLCQLANDCGADSVTVVPLKDGSRDEHVLELYHRIADACPNLAIVVQDYPASTGVHLSIDLLARLATEVKTIQCIKLESLPTVDRLAALHQHPEWNGSKCSILTGLGGLYAGFDLEQGTSSGFMTGFAFPEVLQALHQYAQDGDYKRMHALYSKFLPLIVVEQYGGLALRKEVYRLRGLINNAKLRHPGRDLSPTLRKTLHAQLERHLPGVDLTRPLPEEVLEV